MLQRNRVAILESPLIAYAKSLLFEAAARLYRVRGAVSREASMSSLGPEFVTKISDTLKEACETLARLSGQPVNSLTRDIVAKRIMRCADGGEQNPEIWKAFALGGFADHRQNDERA